MRRLVLALAASTIITTPAAANPDFEKDDILTGVVGDGWGDCVTTVGDVNGDGYSDILISAPDTESGGVLGQGRVYLVYGAPDGFGASSWFYDSLVFDAQFGHSAAPAGDMNADGYDDFVVGAPYYTNGENDEGALYFFLGGASDPTFHTIAEINDADARFGHSVAWAGDVNGDGYDDVIAGAPYWGGFGSPFHIPVQGAAYIYHGGPGGPDNSWDARRTGGDENGEFGWDVAGLGDVNGDGFADVEPDLGPVRARRDSGPSRSKTCPPRPPDPPSCRPDRS